jgi:hypothetical protein
MNSKKAITLLILATMIMALIPITQVYAIDATSLSDTSGDKGDKIFVEGTGVTGGADISVYWDNALKETFTSGTGKLNTTESEPDGTFEIMFKVPEGIAGAHYVWVKDMSSGDVDPNPLEFTVLPKLSADPDTGLEGDDITLEGYGFGEEVDVDEVNITDTFGEAVDYGATETDELGSWSLSFEVPDVGFGDYTITVMDSEGNTASDTFTVGASITLSKDEGPVGTYLRVEGRGFTEDATFDIGDIVLSNGMDYDCWIDNDDDPVEVNSQGRFRADIVIPSAPDGEYEIVATEVGGMGASAAADFDIDEEGQAEIELDPEFGQVGDTITIKGWNFTQLRDTEVVIYVDGDEVKTLETESDGTFEGTFRLPGASGTATVSAVQEDQFIEDEASFRVGSIFVILSNDEGPAGTQVTISGAGFDPVDGDNWNATFDGEEWVGTTNIPGDGVIMEDQLWVPSMEPGVYEVVVTEEDTEISVTLEYTITENTYLELSPMMAPNEYNVSIKGTYFAEFIDGDTDSDLEFILYNETDEWDIDVYFNDVAVELGLNEDWLDEDDFPTGYFEGWFEVPDDEEISIGTYMLNATDGEGMFAQIEFSVVEETQEIEPRKDLFAIGDTVSFNIELSFAEEDSYIEIYDPDGDLFWTTDAFDADVWVTVGSVERVPYYEQTAGGNPMLLLSDAPLGEFTWEYYQEDDDLIDEGVFTVESAPESVLQGQIEDLNNDLAALSQDVSGVSSDIANMQSDVDAATQAANAAVDAANAATDAINSVADQASQAQEAANRAADAAEQAQQATQGLTTLVYGAIGAALVAALAAIVSLMQISQKIAG